LSAGNKHDAPEGRELIAAIYSEHNHYLLMDRAYEDDATQSLAAEQGFVTIVPPKKIGSILGVMITNFTNAETRLSVSFFA